MSLRASPVTATRINSSLTEWEVARLLVNWTVSEILAEQLSCQWAGRQLLITRMTSQGMASLASLSSRQNTKSTIGLYNMCVRCILCVRWIRKHYVVTNTIVSARFSCLQTSMIELKLLRNTQNGLNLLPVTCFGNLTHSHIYYSPRNEITLKRHLPNTYINSCVICPSRAC